FERLPDKVHQADLLGHAVQSQLSVQRFRNPARKWHQDDFFPPSHALPSCRLLTTQPHGSASPPGDAPQTTGLRRTAKGAAGPRAPVSSSPARGTGCGRRPNNNRDGPWQVTFLEIYEKGGRLRGTAHPVHSDGVMTNALFFRRGDGHADAEAEQEARPRTRTRQDAKGTSRSF